MEAGASWRDEVFARLGEGLVVQAADGRILDCNPAAQRILGLTYDRIAGRTSMDPRWAAVHDDGSPFPGDTHPAMVALATGEPVRNVVMGIYRPDGTYAWILVSAVPLAVTPGSQAAVVSSFTDITGEMERAARMLKATVDSMLDPHVLFQAIRDGNGAPVDVRFAEANDAAIDYVRRPRNEVIGAPLRQLFEQRAAAKVLDWVLEVLITGTPFARDEVPLPMPLEDRPRRLDIRAVRVGEYVSFTWRDVTGRGRTSQLLATTEEMFRTAMKAAVTGMAITDLEGRFRVVNEALCQILQLDEGSVLRASLFDLIPEEFLDEIRRGHQRMVAGRDQRSVVEVQLRRADQSMVWVQIGTGLIRDGDGEPQMFLTQVEDVSGEREAREQLAYQAFHDSLTGLRNRTWLLDMLDVELRAAKRGQSRVGVMFIDLDNFKVVNDSLGHAAGDEVLKAVAHRIRRVVRPRDHAGRFGGDEFVVVVTELMQCQAHGAGGAAGLGGGRPGDGRGQTPAHPERLDRHLGLEPGQHLGESAAGRGCRAVPGQGRRPRPLAVLRPADAFTSRGADEHGVADPPGTRRRRVPRALPTGRGSGRRADRGFRGARALAAPDAWAAGCR